MIEIPVVNLKGEKVGTEQIDPAALGGKVRVHLLKQAIITYRANQRQGTVQTKSRAMVHGASKKLYKQKGTGRARAGNLRTPTRRGGGHAFHKINRDFSMKLSRQMRHLARNSAVLAKAIGGTLAIVKGLKFDGPKTKIVAQMLKANAADRSSLLAVTTEEPNLLLSGRNIPNFGVKLVWEMNAYEILKARKLLFTPEAFSAFKADPATAGRMAAKA
jgi:large subunit ribosomal protein L4